MEIIISGSSGSTDAKSSYAGDESQQSGVDAASPARTASTHVRSLDGLRGFAVLAVMCSHLFRGNYAAGGFLVRAAGHIFEFGATGVDLFFVLSGFLITGILYDSLNDSAYFRKFYVRRCLRIFPLYYGVLIVLLALTPVLGIKWHKMQWSLLLYLQNTDLIAPIWTFSLPHGLDLIHFWSLAVEEQFYLVWPLVVFLVRDRKRLLAVCLSMAMGSLLLRFYLALHNAPFPYINYGTLCRADALLAGAAIALLVRSPLKKSTIAFGQTAFWAALLALGAMSGASALLHRFIESGSHYDDVFFAMHYTLTAIGCSGLLAWCLRSSSVAAAFFENRSLRWLGRYSYGLYVLHLVTLGWMLRKSHEWLAYVTSSRLVITLVSGLIVFAVSLVLAFVSFHLYEKPILRLKRFFEYDRPERIPVMVEQVAGSHASEDRI